MRHLIAVLGLVLACSGAAYSQQGKAEAEKLKRTLTGDDKMSAANNERCKLYSKAEVAAYMGMPVNAMDNAAGAMGCIWTAKAEGNLMMVTVVPARYYEAASMAKGFKKLPGVGQKGFVVPDMGWAAGAILGKEFIRVQLDGKGASEASAIALLKETMKRRAQAGPK
jgi:hypothetical protein